MRYILPNLRLGEYFFVRTLPDGRRQIGWRTWVLIWVAPVLFVAASLMMFAWEGYRHLATTPTTGEVVQVYEWEGTSPFDRGVALYGPVFRYTWVDGQPTEATSGMSHPDFNFPIGSVHEIRYFPDAKRNVVLPGIHNWMAPAIILGIGAVLLIPALWGTFRLKRWQRKGSQ